MLTTSLRLIEKHMRIRTIVFVLMLFAVNVLPVNVEEIDTFIITDSSIITKQSSDSVLTGQFKHTCGLSCYVFITLKEDSTYEYGMFGDTTFEKGTFQIRRNKQIILTPDNRAAGALIKKIDLIYAADSSVALKHKEDIFYRDE